GLCGAGVGAGAVSRQPGADPGAAAAGRPAGLLRAASRGLRGPARPVRARPAGGGACAQRLGGAGRPAAAAGRGLVLIDPPFERPDEFARLAAGVGTANARFATGVLAAWYPIKHRAPVRAFHDAIRESGLRDVVAAELWLREPTDPGRLNGCGLLVVNPPYRFEAEAAPILDALLARL